MRDFTDFQKNPNTLVYLTDALNNATRRVDTLAKETSEAVENTNTDVEGLRTYLGEVYTNLGGLINAMPDSLLSIYQAVWLQDIMNGNGDVVGTKELSKEQSALSQTAKTIRADFEKADEDYQNYIKSYIQFDATGITIGELGSPFKMIIRKNRIEIWNTNVKTDGPITYWDTGVMYTPSSLEVPTGGTLAIGNFKFIARNSGNISLV